MKPAVGSLREMSGRSQNSAYEGLSILLLRDQNLLYSINGYIEGNHQMLIYAPRITRTLLPLSNGNEDDVHMAHWHGNNAMWNSMRMDTLFLGPMAMATADMIPDSEGIWLFHCHVNDPLFWWHGGEISSLAVEISSVVLLGALCRVVLLHNAPAVILYALNPCC